MLAALKSLELAEFSCILIYANTIDAVKEAAHTSIIHSTNGTLEKMVEQSLKKVSN